MTDPIDGMAALPLVYSSVEEGRERIKAKDWPELVAAEGSPEG